jgi:peptidoglycan/LPS O-acetylase OafA/YrhL
MKKLESIQLLRGIAALGVVLFHCLAIENKYFATAKVLPRMFELGQTGVDLFFVISGFVMVTVTRGRHGLPLESWRFLWARLTRIYPTYWFYFFLTTIVFIAKPNWVNAAQGHKADLLTSFFLIPSEYLPLVMVAWSLIHELWFYIVFSMFLWLPERFLPVLLLIWAFIVAMANLALASIPLSPCAKLVVHPYSVEFILGALAALLSQRLRRVLTKTELFGALALTCASLIMVPGSGILSEPNMLRSVTLGLLYSFAVSVVAIAERSDLFRVHPAFSAVGDSSYTIYLSHVMILSAMGRLWSLWFPVATNSVVTALVFFAILVSVVVYGLAGYRFVELPTLRVSHQLRTLWFDNRRNKHAC